MLSAGSSCIISNDNRDIYRQEYIEPEQIQSEHFVIHFTIADDDFQDIMGSYIICNLIMGTLNQL